MAQEAEAKYAFVVSLASLLFFFLSSFNQMDFWGGIHISDNTQIFNLCRFDPISSCLGETFKKFIGFEVEKIIFLLQMEEQTMDAFNLFMIVDCVTPL
jgi:hypothetical protein